MNEYLIKKVIAMDGEREIVESDQEEMHRFIVENTRPDFDNSHVLCVKFLYCVDEEDDDPEETCWYINPAFCTKPSFCGYSAYGPKMDSAFIPELLLIDLPGRDVFKKYETFHTELLVQGLNGLSDRERLELFLRRVKVID